jgi:hypothetical protein
MAHAHKPSSLEGRDRRTANWGQPGQKHKTLSEKITKAKRAGSTAQVVECMPSKH